MKKIVFVFVLLTLVALSACGPHINMKQVYGTWLRVNDSDLDIADEKELVTFAKDGTYTVIRYKKNRLKDSLKGTFELLEEEKQINMTNEGWTLKDMTVVNLSDTAMSVKMVDDLSASFTSRYRRQ